MVQPPVPPNIKRQLLLETGYRCAICGERFPLEFHHIVPFAEVREHLPGRMIVLCANCHRQAHDCAWEEEVLTNCKRTPWTAWAFRNLDLGPPVTITRPLAISPAFCEPHSARLYEAALAARLGVPPAAVHAEANLTARQLRVQVPRDVLPRFGDPMTRDAARYVMVQLAGDSDDPLVHRLEERHAELVERKHLGGLNADEQSEFEFLVQDLEKTDELFYAPILERAFDLARAAKSRTE